MRYINLLVSGLLYYSTSAYSICPEDLTETDAWSCNQKARDEAEYKNALQRRALTEQIEAQERRSKEPVFVMDRDGVQMYLPMRNGSYMRY